MSPWFFVVTHSFLVFLLVWYQINERRLYRQLDRVYGELHDAREAVTELVDHVEAQRALLQEAKRYVAVAEERIRELESPPAAPVPLVDPTKPETWGDG